MLQLRRGSVWLLVPGHAGRGRDQGGPDWRPRRLQALALSSKADASLFWSSNRGKRSVAVDLQSPEGREIVTGLATTPGPDAGIVVDNNVGQPWLSYDALAARRADLIQVHIQGYNDGRPAVVYTVNAEVGLPGMTGPTGVSAPVNHVLPAWDLLTGMTAATALLAALRRRDQTSQGSYVELALADVALAGVASMGWLAEAVERGDRPRHGNHVYGSFGVDFATKGRQPRNGSCVDGSTMARAGSGDWDLARDPRTGGCYPGRHVRRDRSLPHAGDHRCGHAALVRRTDALGCHRRTRWRAGPVVEVSDDVRRSP